MPEIFDIEQFNQANTPPLRSDERILPPMAPDEEKTHNVDVLPEFANEVDRIFFVMQEHWQQTSRGPSLKERLEKIKALKKSLKKYKSALKKAAMEDMAKTSNQFLYFDWMPITEEIKNYEKNLKKWTKLNKIQNNYYFANYPQGIILLINEGVFIIPQAIKALVCALGAGNKVILKTSNQYLRINRILKIIINEAFSKREVEIIHGDDKANQYLYKLGFNRIVHNSYRSFFPHRQDTRSFLSHSAQSLSLVIDDQDKIKDSAYDLASLMALNLAKHQLCPKFVFIESELHDEFVEELAAELKKYLGDDARAVINAPYQSRYNEQEFEAAQTFLEQVGANYGSIPWGGFSNNEQKLICPSIVTGLKITNSLTDKIWSGPFLVVHKYENKEAVLNKLKKFPLKMTVCTQLEDQAFIFKLASQVKLSWLVLGDVLRPLVLGQLPEGENAQFIGSTTGKIGLNSFSHNLPIVISKNKRPKWRLKANHPLFRPIIKLKNLFS